MGFFEGLEEALGVEVVRVGGGEEVVVEGRHCLLGELVLVAASGGDLAGEFSRRPFLLLYFSRMSGAFLKCGSGSHEFSAWGRFFHFTR